MFALKHKEGPVFIHWWVVDTGARYGGNLTVLEMDRVRWISGLTGQPSLEYLVSSSLMRDLVSTNKVDSTQEMAVRVVLLAPHTCMYTCTQT